MLFKNNHIFCRFIFIGISYIHVSSLNIQSACWKFEAERDRVSLQISVRALRSVHWVCPMTAGGYSRPNYREYPLPRIPTSNLISWWAFRAVGTPACGHSRLWVFPTWIAMRNQPTNQSTVFTPLDTNKPIRILLNKAKYLWRHYIVTKTRYKIQGRLIPL